MSDAPEGTEGEASRPEVISSAVLRIGGPSAGFAEDRLVREEPLEVRLRDTAVAVLMRTPGHDEELACGFVVTEGVVARGDVRFASHCRTVPLEARGNVINVMIPDRVAFDPEAWQRNTLASSACGVCGKATLDRLFVRADPLTPLARPLVPEEIGAAMAAMRAQQAVFDQTGGLHAAGLVDLRRGRLVVVREDVGRHNTVDKVIGWAALQRRLPLSDHLLVVSGRAGFEIVQKAWVAGIPALASVSAPSSLAVAMAQRAGMVLIGFVRGDRMNVYAGAEHTRQSDAAP